MLEDIYSPADLKKIEKTDLPNVCKEIRDLIIDTVSKNGGHLASSLGVVELTTALHYVFDSPNDKIIWDVGHQSYAHKIITGRKDRFHTLRQLNGISGFPKREESEHDVFGTGHASTSISAAVGIAEAIKKKGVDNRVIAIIGDGSMTGGMAFEALNHAGHKAGNLIIILNDNEMSISSSVGALSKFLSVHLYGGRARRFRTKIKKLLSFLPFWGKEIYQITQKAEEATVSFFTPGFLFEAFGFDYIGPLDGHNLDELIAVFNDIRQLAIGDKPILVHVLTKKGKGYAPAEKNPTLFHGIGRFDKKTGEPLPSNGQSFTQAFSNALIQVAHQDDRIIAITAAMCTGTGLEDFSNLYPDRFYDVGIAEGHAVTFAAGMATLGYKPVVAIYSTFLQRAYDQIIHDVCLQNIPVIFAIDRAGLVGDDGATHHGAFDISFLRTIPNLVLAAPRDGEMFDEWLQFALNYNGPVAMRWPRGSAPKITKNFVRQKLELGKAETILFRGYSRATIWAVGNMVGEALKAADELDKMGINVIVADPRFIKPFDVDLFKELLKYNKNIITVEENILQGGFGSMIGELIREENLSDVSLACIGLPDEFVKHGTQQELRKKYNLYSSGIAGVVREFLNKDNETENNRFVSKEILKHVGVINSYGMKIN